MKEINIRFKSLITLLIFGVNLTFSQINSSTVTITLEEIKIKALKIKNTEKTVPFAISLINFNETQKKFQQLSLQEYLEGIPGLFSSNANNFAQDLRVSLRGFGARSAFGIRGIKIIIDGIPETTPDGQGQIDNVSLGLIEEIEVLRGPQASLYGNASGGVIFIKTIDSLSKSRYLFKSSLGDYNLQSYQFTSYLNNKNTSAIIYLNDIEIDGFRENSSLKQKAFNVKLKHKFSDKSILNFQFNYTDSPLAEDAGGLTKEEASFKWNMARQRNIDYKTFEKINQAKIGFNWEKKIDDKIEFNLFSFYSNRDFYGKLPFEYGGIIDLDREYKGFGSNITYNSINENLIHSIQVGIESYFQNDFRKRYKNIIGTKGNNVFDQNEKFNTTGIYLIDNIESNKWIIRTSLRYDNLFINTDSTKYNKRYNVVNPSFGVTHKLNNDKYLFFNFSTSFETPTLSELSANPSGNEGFNFNLNPSKAYSYEFGWRSYKSNFLIETNLFFIRSSNEILPYELENFPGRSFYRNTGKTERKGFELYSRLKLGKLKLEGSLTYAQYTFLNNNSFNKVKSSNNLPGIPGHQWFFNFNYNLKNRWITRLIIEKIGGFYADNLNTVFVNSFYKTRYQILKSINFNSNILEISAGINNLLNTKYYDNIRLNAFGSRYYEPAPGRNLYVNFALRL